MQETLTTKEKIPKNGLKKISTEFWNKIKKYLKNKYIKRENNGYRICYYRCGVLRDLSNNIEYDGKFMIRNSYEKIENEIVPKLLVAMDEKKINLFKYKDPTTPMSEKYKNDKPPLFIYCKNREKDKCLKILEDLWIDDRFRIFDDLDALWREKAIASQLWEEIKDIKKPENI